MSDTQLICPSDTSKAYANHHKLLPFHRFLNLTHTDKYIHNPFNYATVNGQKSRDQICQVNWDIPLSKIKMFHNPLPPSEVPLYSVHVDHCAHTTFHNTCFLHDLSSPLQPKKNITNTQFYPWQKVLGTSAVNPYLFILSLAPLGMWWLFSHHDLSPFAMVSGHFCYQWSSFHWIAQALWIPWTDNCHLLYCPPSTRCLGKLVNYFWVA